MYNSIQYNEALYNEIPAVTVEESSDVFQFDSYGLQNSNIITQNINFSTAPTREIETNNVPRAHGDFLNDEQFRKRTITLEGFIKADSAPDLEALIDTMKKRLSLRNGNLDVERTVTVGGVSTTITERFVATLKSPEKLFGDRKGYHLTMCPFKAEFLCLDPFGYEPDHSTTSLLTQTDSSLNQTITNDGTAEGDLTIIILIGAVLSFTSLLVTNNTTDEEMEITTSLAIGDILEIDSENKTVKKNGTEIDYNGQFISLDPGDNLISLDFTSTSQTYDVTYKHKDAYL